MSRGTFCALGAVCLFFALWGAEQLIGAILSGQRGGGQYWAGCVMNLAGTFGLLGVMWLALRRGGTDD